MKLTEENIIDIKVRFKSLETVEQLAQLLSFIYNLKFPNRNKDKIILIEAKHLNYYAFNSQGRYKEFSIKKKSGGERKISAPRYKLKTIQKCINELLNAIFTPHFTATGFVQNKSIVDNAKLHIDKQYVFNTDLKDFFPSTEFGRVKAVLKLAPFFFTDNQSYVKIENESPVKKGKGYLGFLIANLCCEKGGLPQGAPTSPTITNIVCQRLDKKLFKFAKSIKATYTRYADDITFSSNKPVFDEKFKIKLVQIIEIEEKFKINFEKERLQKSGERQVVTGLVVNKKSNVERKYLKDIRFWLWCWGEYKTEKTQQKFLIQFPDKKGYLRYNGATPQFQNYLSGKILFFGMVRGANDGLFLKFKTEFDRLNNLNKANEVQNPIEKNLNFTQPNFSLKNILDIWEKEGFEKAINSFY